MEPVISRDAIDRLAQQAATRYSNVNEACPYPFGTAAADAFCELFKRYREQHLNRVEEPTT